MTEEFDQILTEAYASIEDQLQLEDAGWIKLGAATGGNILSAAQRADAVKRARIYAIKDPLARQAIRLWTDYAFGTGMTWAAEDERVNEVLSTFWQAPENQSVFSCQGQRKSSDKLLIDGEIFFALFLGPQKATLRRIDPLEITEIVTDPDDLEDVRYYKREWSTTAGQQKVGYYRSAGNIKDVAALDLYGKSIKASEDALVFHLAMNTIGQRGNSMLLPVIDWIKLYRQFLASRVAIMLALARFAWKVKVQGGAATVAAAKGAYNETLPAAGSVAIENASADLQPIRTDSGAQNAYQDGRQIKLQVAAGTGFPEQYYGDISIGNLATAKTVELPVSKMIQSYQAIWGDMYSTIDKIVLAQNGIPEDKWYIDRDFPPITPADESAMATNIAAIGTIMPELLSNRDVMQMALMSIGIHDTNEVIEDILKSPQESAAVALSKALRMFKETIGKMP